MYSLIQRIVTIRYRGIEIGVSVSVVERTDVWIVALHGLQAAKELYAGLNDQDFTQAYSFLAIDFVGFGESEKPDDFSYALEDQAAMVLQVLNQLDIQRMHLIGHSLGGMVGTLLLDQLGERVLSFANLEGNLVLADCGASKDVAETNFDEFVTSGYPRLQAGIDQSGEPSAEARSRWLKNIPAQAFYKSAVSIVALSKSEKLLGLFNGSNVRRLFIYGSKNPHKADVVSSTVSKAEIRDAGHFMLLDQPEACYGALRAFITRK